MTTVEEQIRELELLNPEVETIRTVEALRRILIELLKSLKPNDPPRP